MDPGGSWQGAEMLHEAIRTVTDQPVEYVINTGGQDHRWLGNGYWQEQGATVIASDAAVADHRARAQDHMIALSQFLGDGLDGTEPAYADVTYQTDYTLEFGGLGFEIMHRGAAHTPGDSFVWLDERDVMFTGDIVYVDRLLGNGPARDTDSWIAVFEAMAAFEPAHIVPGHGGRDRSGHGHARHPRLSRESAHADRVADRGRRRHHGRAEDRPVGLGASGPVRRAGGPQRAGDL